MSIADVAKRAGVSRATVSRVINKRNGVSPQVISVVKEAVAALGYQPPPLERRPGRRVPIPLRASGGMIAVVLLNELYHRTPGVFAAHLGGIEREASEHGLGVLVCHAQGNRRLPPALLGKQIEGLILLGSYAAPDVLDALRRYPSVWLSSHHDSSGDTVLAGNQQISKIAVDYLVGRGHRQLGYLAVMSSYPAYPARAEAFRFFASQHTGDVSVFMDDPKDPIDIRLQDTHVLQQRINQQIDRLVKTCPRPTGLFVANDLMTAMCYVALRARGVIPGKDIEIISCNNEISYLVGLDPRPATIDIGAEMMGRRSVEQLLRRIRHPDESRQVHLAVTPVLIEGTSSSWKPA